MTKIIGITGGMGSGKSTVCRIFNSLGVPVFNADSEAKQLMTNHFELIAAIKENFGEEVYDKKNNLNRKLLASKVFTDPEQLKLLNSLVHPVVFKAFDDWRDKQIMHSYVIKEAAIMFESGSDKGNDINILVSSPQELRIARIMKRDGITREEIMGRLKHQMPEETLLELCDLEIKNNETDFLIPQILELHKRFSND